MLSMLFNLLLNSLIILLCLLSCLCLLVIGNAKPKLPLAIPTGTPVIVANDTIQLKIYQHN